MAKRWSNKSGKHILIKKNYKNKIKNNKKWKTLIIYEHLVVLNRKWTYLVNEDQQQKNNRTFEIHPIKINVKPGKIIFRSFCFETHLINATNYILFVVFWCDLISKNDPWLMPSIFINTLNCMTNCSRILYTIQSKMTPRKVQKSILLLRFIWFYFRIINSLLNLKE